MNWEQLLDDHHIYYVSRGPNTRKGEISVQCPWCGDEDPSQHLGIVLNREAWGCHRDSAHRGKKPHRLIQVLLGCSFSQAKLIVAQYDAADPDALGEGLLALETQSAANIRAPEALQMLPEFAPITATGSAKRFYWYLTYRGFNPPDEAIARYNLRCCATGRWKDRLIIPVYSKSELVAWTGRALQKSVSAPRYLSTSDTIKTVVFNEDEAAKGGNLLFVTEGPFDAMKVDYFGHENGAKAVAVFGTSITIDQISILKKLHKLFQQTILLFDTDATETAFNMSEWLPGALVGGLPYGVKDPGDLTRAQVLNLIDEFKFAVAS